MNAYGTTLVLLKLVVWVLGWVRDGELLTEGQRQELGAILQEQASALTRADKVRADQAARNHAVPPDHELPDDGFRRD